MSWISALSGIAGTIIGASATVTLTWITQRAHQRRELWRERLKKNEKLYGEFIEQYARLLVDAVQHQLDRPETMLPAYALINRIRLCASNEILDAVATTVIHHPEFVLIEVAGHADERASDEYMLKLTQDRVNSVMAALIARKVERSRLRAKGYGEFCPEDPGHNEEA